jgi:N-acetylglucosaminyldiphosphoundecaprenol N-acetyl-beta-D-mannosaminyltransferase
MPNVPAPTPPRTRLRVLGVPIDTGTAEGAVQRMLAWARGRDSRYVCACNVHSVVTARQDAAFAAAVEGADLATPDGAPVAWMLRRLGAPGQRRVSGPDLMWQACAAAAAGGIAVYLYGSTEATLSRLRERLQREWPLLEIAGAMSPPFRPLSPAEDDAIVDEINRSGAGLVWVSLGCPKQEQWMAAHRGRVQAVMVGVGAAFDFHAGTKPRAPAWMRDSGLEWLHRLASEPLRLTRRYLTTNSLFVLGALQQLARRR